ncbi:MAG: amidase domain-containing protein [Clostridia bacterium]|nr:amidase domain-containing protein [Clostridia bacterium]
MPTSHLYRGQNIVPYDREKAVEYAHKWALKRNPDYYDFEKLGGDCTSFASQCIYAGSGVMNYKPIYGWYYENSHKRTASWSGVHYLYDFLINNKGAGPYAKEVGIDEVEPGDIIQLSFDGGGRYNHTPVVVEVGNPVKYENILIAAHSIDRDNYPLSNYKWVDIRFLHILGARNK